MSFLLPSQRVTNTVGALACLAMMAYALYSQYVLGLEPCPLCSLQRIAVIAIGIIFVLAAIRDRTGVHYAAPLGLFAVLGAGVAGWHIHLQNLPPDEVPSCGPDLGYILETVPLLDIFAVIFKGTGQCADVSWRFLGLSMPVWVLLGLIGLGVAGVWNNLRSEQQRP